MLFTTFLKNYFSCRIAALGDLELPLTKLSIFATTKAKIASGRPLNCQHIDLNFVSCGFIILNIILHTKTPYIIIHISAEVHVSNGKSVVKTSD